MDGWDVTLGTPGIESIDNQPDAQLEENDQAPGVDNGLPQRRGLDLDYHHDDHKSPLYVGKVQLMDELRYKMKEQLDVIGVKRKRWMALIFQLEFDYPPHGSGVKRDKGAKICFSHLIFSFLSLICFFLNIVCINICWT
jgi:hypothetical protein